MLNALSALIAAVSKTWQRFNRILTEENDRRVAAWGSALQYKRRYTNPDAAKRFRSQS
jgi:hypothetical protein